MMTLQRRIAAVTSFLGQLRELGRLRARVKKAMDARRSRRVKMSLRRTRAKVR
jgi:hypothetical protein